MYMSLQNSYAGILLPKGDGTSTWHVYEMIRSRRWAPHAWNQSPYKRAPERVYSRVLLCKDPVRKL